MNKWWIPVLAGLLIGYAAGSVVGPSQLLKEDVDEKEAPVIDNEPPEAVEVAAVVPGDSESEKKVEEVRTSMQAEIDELQTLLDNARAEVASHVAELDKLRKDTPQKQNRDKARKSWTELMKEREERLKKEDPEAYAERQKQRKEFQDKMEGAVAEKSAFLVNMDTSDMTEDEKKGHEELQARIAEAWDVMNKLQEGKRPELEDWAKMRENYEVISELYDMERDYALRQVGKTIGYDKTEAADFSTQIQDIFEQTSPRMPRSTFSGFGRHSSHRSSSHGNNQTTQPAPAQTGTK